MAFLLKTDTHSNMHKQSIPAQTLWCPIIASSDCTVSVVCLPALMQDDEKMAALGRRWLFSIRGDVRVAEDRRILPG